VEDHRSAGSWPLFQTCRPLPANIPLTVSHVSYRFLLPGHSRILALCTAIQRIHEQPFYRMSTCSF
jgi:hypothetical protein